MRNWLIGLVIAIGLCLPPADVSAQGSVPPEAEPSPSSLMGDEIVARAKEWIDAKVPYSQAAYYNGYRTDCSGFVSFAWQIHTPDGRTHSPDGVTLANQFGSLIEFERLAPGDILDNMQYGDGGHVVIFVRWIEKGVSFEAYEENGGVNYSRAVATRLTLQALRGGGMTIVEYEEYAPGPYYAFRSQGIPGYAVVTGPPCVWKTPGNCTNTVLVGEEVTATFTIKNEGGSALVLRQLMAGARGPWARVQGWMGPNADFPPEVDVIVQPGQSYTYSRARSFNLVGDYFVEALLNESDWVAITPFPRIEFDVVKAR
jgi:hypothetical protein